MPYPAPTLSESPRADAEELARTARLFLGRSPVVGVRALSVPTAKDGTPSPRSSYARTLAGYYDDPDTLAADVARIDAAGASGVYLSLHGIDPLTLHRAPNQTGPAASKGRAGVVAVSESDVLRRFWLPLDCDALTPDPSGGWRKRPEGVNASEEEAARQLDAARRIAEEARRRFGLPPFVLAASGNGGHALFPIDLPAADDGLTKRALAGLAVLAAELGIGPASGTDVDGGVFDPARIWKLYGTAARKGSATEGPRPARRSRIVSAPCDLSTLDGPRALELATRESLEALAALAPAPEPKPRPAPVATGDGDALTDAEIARLLAPIPSGSYPDWFGTIGAVHAACGFDASRSVPLLEGWSPEGDGPNAYAAKIADGAGSVYSDASPAPLIARAKAHGFTGPVRERRAVERPRPPAPSRQPLPTLPSIPDRVPDPSSRPSGIGPHGDSGAFPIPGPYDGKSRETGSAPPPIAPLFGFAEPPAREWIVPGWIPKGYGCIVAADGGSGKSYLAVLAGICVATGRPFLGKRVERAGVLYVDYELDVTEQRRRVSAVLAGLGMTPDAPELRGAFHYVRPTRSLIDGGAEEIAAAARATGATFVILDSLTIALGGNSLEQKDVTQAMNALRPVGTYLAIDHVSAAGARGSAKDARPFGSTFKRNIARATFQLVTEEGGVRVLRPDKSNFGPGSEPVSYRMEFDGAEGLAVRFNPLDVADADDAAVTLRHLSASEKVTQAVRTIYAAHPAAHKIGGILADDVHRWLEDRIEFGAPSLKTVQNTLSAIANGKRGRVTLRKAEPSGYLPAEAEPFTDEPGQIGGVVLTSFEAEPEHSEPAALGGRTLSAPSASERESSSPPPSKGSGIGNGDPRPYAPIPEGPPGRSGMDRERDREWPGSGRERFGTSPSDPDAEPLAEPLDGDGWSSRDAVFAAAGLPPVLPFDAPPDDE